jgi:hypothetical protein
VAARCAGDVILGDLVLIAGDGAGVTTERSVSLTARGDSELLLFDVADAKFAAHDLQDRPA